jgi:two-component system response regulator HydG
LDEIGEFTRPLQAKLTRALEERAVRRLGESIERPVDVRLIVATHRDLEAMVREETFRRDLWYRLNVAVMRILPLRERQEDIELLARYFLRERQSASPNPRTAGFSDTALAALRAYDWPGNVRQLRAAIERASVVTTGAQIDLGDLSPEILHRRAVTDEALDLTSLTWTQALEKGREEVARRYIEEVLTKHDGRVAEAAAHARVERESFYRLMRRFNIDPDHYRSRRGPGTGGRS